MSDAQFLSLDVTIDKIHGYVILFETLPITAFSRMY